MTNTIGIYVFDEVEVLDFGGPYEVFTAATRIRSRIDTIHPDLFKVFLVGRTVEPVRARAGLIVIPDYSFSNHPPIDTLIIPGGVVTAELLRPEVILWISAASALSTITASVCTGSFLLAQANLLDGKPATTHWEDINDLKTMFPSVNVQTDKRWIDTGKIVTSGGITSGIDMSLHIVERIAGRELAIRTARQIEFDWTEDK